MKFKIISDNISNNSAVYYYRYLHKYDWLFWISDLGLDVTHIRTSLIAVNLINWWVKYCEIIVIHVNNEYYIWTLTKPILNARHFIDLFLKDVIAWGLLLYNINAIINICMQLWKFMICDEHSDLNFRDLIMSFAKII